MEKLWSYKDFVDKLSHPESLVRAWAYRVLRDRFPRRFTPEISSLIKDLDEYLASVAPKYLSDHKATEFAPAILESFLERKGNVPGNCAIALGDMAYEPAADAVLAALPHCRDADTLIGILHYLAKIHREDCHRALQDAVVGLSDHYLVETAARYLLEHGDPADVPLVLKTYFNKADPKVRSHSYLERLMASVDATSLFDDFLEYNRPDLLNEPQQSIAEVIKEHPLIRLDSDWVRRAVEWIEAGKYRQLATSLMADAQGIVRARSSEGAQAGGLEDLLRQDRLALAFIEEISRHLANFRQATGRENIVKNIVAAVLACHLSIVERSGYARAMGPESDLPDVLEVLKSTGKELPQILHDKLVQLASVSELKASLTKDLSTWGDIWTVRLMGRIGDSAFIPDLVRIVLETEGTTYIHEGAIKALNGIDEAGHEELFEAVKGRITNEIDILALLEHLPYPEAFDLALQLWRDDRVDFLETFSICLEGIGDERGIDVLREVYEENGALSIGESLETLCLLHGREVPELSDIRNELEEHRKKSENRMKELNELAAKASKGGFLTSPGAAAAGIPRKKIGRNDPCPCGSRKKYKKCCLGKE